MVLGELSGSISLALQKMNNETVIDEKALNDCLNEITRALLKADVHFNFVKNLTMKIKKIAIFNELCRMLDTGKPSFMPKKGKTSVIMFVGLQGSGKTTSCAKYVHYHQKKGFKPALVCADTFRAGAFDQLKQNATKAKIPFYGSYMESDPVKIAIEGVERFKKEHCDLYYYRYKWSPSAGKTRSCYFRYGQAAFSQAQAFNQSVSVGAVIVTKTEGAAKGGGALSAVAATKSPVIFLGTGEHMYEFEVFDVKPFVSRLLGIINSLSGFMEKIHDAVPMDQQSDLLQKLSEGKFSLRIMYQLYENLLNIFSVLPGNSAELMPKGDEKESWLKIKRYMTMMDSMTNEELDSTDPKFMNESRVMRVARGSGCQIRDVMEMLEEYKRQAKVWGKMKGFFEIPKKGEKSALSRNMNPQQMSGMGGLQNLMKQMGSSKDMMGMLGNMGGMDQ
ncbi:hypothetical protein MKX03_021798 [Papaver bracteatum]|nr:hypothetical protein MKX03_021798 [Papaver bracteatum]